MIRPTAKPIWRSISAKTSPLWARRPLNGSAAFLKRPARTCKVSSIHVNGWFGDYDKLQMAGTFARDRLNVSLEAEKAHFVYCGDSPNDEPMFRFFPLSVGVHNVLQFKNRMTHLPAFVTPAEGGKGFAQLAERILKYRRKGGKGKETRYECWGMRDEQGQRAGKQKTGYRI